MGGSVCCETAIHFDFITDLGYSVVEPEKITYASCVTEKDLVQKVKAIFTGISKTRKRTT